MVKFKDSIKLEFDIRQSSVAQDKSYQSEYRKKFKRIDLICSPQIHAELIKSAKKHKRKLSPFIVECATAYLQEGFVVPDKEEVREIKFALKRWGNNLNQIARHVNTNRSVEIADLQQMLQQMKKLEDMLTKIFEDPKSIRISILAEARKDPMLVPRLVFLLSTIKQ